MSAVFTRAIPAALAAGLAVSPLAAYAQSPTYTAPGETIRGTINSVQDLNHITVNDDRGYIDDVTIREGASLSNGARLEPGERVTIVGTNGGNTFLASQLSFDGRATSGSGYSGSTTYANAAPQYVAEPYPVYYPYPAYPYPYYGYYGGFYSPVHVGLFFHFR